MAQRVAEVKFDALALRCLSAVVLITLALVAVLAGGIWLTALILAVAALMAKEWVDFCLTRGGGGSSWTATAVVFMGAVVLTTVAATLSRFLPAIFIMVAGGLAVAALTGLKRRVDDVIFVLGLVYITIPALAVTWIAGDTDHGTKTLIWVLTMVWVSDIGAYVLGNCFGGPKLAPSVSPGKTWSGFIGGLAAAGGLAVIAGATGLTHFSGRFIGLSVLLSLVAQAGDLLESRLKRHLGIKDFGTIIPGHGGVLDRVDGLLTAFPFVACIQLWSGSSDFVWR